MIQGISMPSTKKVKNCDLLINCSSCTHKKIQWLYIGLKESKIVESHSKTLDIVIRFLYGDSITTVGVVKYC